MGPTTATIQSASVAVSHLLTSTLVRATGFEIVQARVPLSRSAMSRLMVAKIEARTMNCVPIREQVVDRLHGQDLGRAVPGFRREARRPPMP